MVNISKDEHLNNIVKGSKKYLAFLPLWKELNANNIPYANIKGEALSLQAYNAYGYRKYGDIDILVCRKDISIIKKILNKVGFIEKDINNTRERKIFMQTFSHQTKAYMLPFDGSMLHLDVNFDVFWGEYEGTHINMPHFLADVQNTNIYGINIKTLPPFKAFIQTALHHYKDMNSIFLIATRKKIRLQMFEEVYFLLKNNSNSIPVNTLYTYCYENNMIPYIFYILFYTNFIFKDSFLNDYIDALRTEEGEKLLNCYGLAKAEMHNWKYDFNFRLNSQDLYELIKNDLTETDVKKIEINKKMFL